MSYGLAGGGLNGQPFRRWDVAADPSQMIPVFAAGSVNSMTPAFLMDARGGVYRYGGTPILGGIINMISDGMVLRSVINQDIDISGADVTLILGGTTDVITNASQTTMVRALISANQSQVQKVFMLVDGEFAYQATTGASHYGAVAEPFTFAAATLTVTTGANFVTTTLANGFTSAATLPGYAYTPGIPTPYGGDIIEIVDGGVSRYYRLGAIPQGVGSTTANIYPNYVGAGGPGLTYRLWRAGYGSWSNVAKIYNGQSVYHYYAGSNFGIQGNTYNPSTAWGTIYCLAVSPTGSTVTHFTCPQTSAAVTPYAVDVAYYKGFLLYGAGTGISWSAAGFPSSFTTGFGATDLPAVNVSAFNTGGNFLRFAQIGEQTIAMFDDSVWLVQATGSIPEFAFYKLPGTIGPIPVGSPDVQIAGLTSAPPWAICPLTVAGPDSAYMVEPGGVKRLSGISRDRIAQAVENIVVGSNGTATYDESFGLFLSGSPGNGAGLLFTPDTASWTAIAPFTGAGVVGLSVGELNSSLTGRAYRPLTMSYWRANRVRRLSTLDTTFEGTEYGPAIVSKAAWLWPSPIISLGDIYPGFIFGGFRVWARAGDATTATLTWSIYGGASPNGMVQRQTNTFVYTIGTVSGRDYIGQKEDDAYIAIVLTGSEWIELTGVAIYSAAALSGR